jgi:hypothetical protein
MVVLPAGSLVPTQPFLFTVMNFEFLFQNIAYIFVSSGIRSQHQDDAEAKISWSLGAALALGCHSFGFVA